MVIKNVPCCYCLQTHSVRKYGKAKSGYQRYMCKHCQRTFQLRYVYSAYKKRGDKYAKLGIKPIDS